MKNTLGNLVEKYTEEIGKDLDQLQDARVVKAPTMPGDRMATRVELVYGGEAVMYTRVVDILTTKVKFRSVTQKTRLHIPIQIAPRDATMYIEGVAFTLALYSDGKGAYSPVYLLKHKDADTKDGMVLADSDIVEVECFHAAGEGILIGGILVATEEEMAPFASPEDLAETCKFGMLEFAMNTYWENGHK